MSEIPLIPIVLRESNAVPSTLAPDAASTPNSRHDQDTRTSLEDTASIDERASLTSPSASTIADHEPTSNSKWLIQLCSSISRKVHEWWWWEVSALVLSVASMMGIIIVLAIWDGRPLREWRFGIQPNSLIATLSTISKTAMLVVLAASISELKWLHYKEAARSLHQLQYFDEASRGPWGATTLILSVDARAKLASFGAILTVLALAMEPTAQQVLAFPPATTILANDTAKLGVAERYTSLGQITSGFATVEGRARLASIATEGAMGRAPSPDYTCPDYATECQWLDHTTLAACMACESTTDVKATCRWNDLSEESETSSQSPRYLICAFESPAFVEWIAQDSNANLTLIQGNFADVDPYRSAYTSFNPSPQTVSVSVNKSFHDQPSDDSLNGVSMFFLRTGIQWNVSSLPIEDLLLDENLPKPESTLQMCTWRWCERAYPDTVLRGSSLHLRSFHERRLDEFELEGATYRLSGNGTKEYWVDRDAFWGIRDSVLAKFVGTSQVDTSQDDTGALFDEEIVDEGTAMPDVLRYREFTDAQHGILDAFNAQIRSSTMDNPNATLFLGRVLVLETYIDVRWPWLVLPIAEPMLASLLLIATIIVSRGRPLWKASLIALLYHGLEGWQDDELLADELGSVDAYTEASRGQTAVLDRNDNGYVKLLRVYGPRKP